MSWSISVCGDKKGVKQAVEKAQAYGSDPSQLDLAKALIISEIEAMPEDAGVRVEAGGHHDSHFRNLNIKVDRVYLALGADEESKPSEVS